MEAAEDTFVEAEIEADAEYLAELVAIARLPVPPQVKAAMGLAALAKKSFDIYTASRARTAAEREDLLPQQEQPGPTQVALDDIQNRPNGTVTVTPAN